MSSAAIVRACRGTLRGIHWLAVPPQCPACSSRIARPGKLCGACAERFAGENEPITVDLDGFRVHAIAPFAGVWAKVVRSYKEDPTPGVADLVEPLFAQLLGELEGPAPTLVPVPMAAVRRRERGFSPADRLATMMARELGWPIELRVLRRVRYRRPLRGLSAAERRAEIQGAIVAGSEATDWSTKRIPADPLASGQWPARTERDPVRILLVDDVLTTGSTLEACAAALQSLGLSRLELVAAVLGATPAGGT